MQSVLTSLTTNTCKYIEITVIKFTKIFLINSNTVYSGSLQKTLHELSVNHGHSIQVKNPTSRNLGIDIIIWRSCVQAHVQFLLP